MSLQCVPKPPLSLCHVCVFSTHPLLLHIESASLTANTAFSFLFFFFLARFRQCQEEFGRKQEKREKISMQMQTDV